LIKPSKEGAETYIMYQGANTRTVASIILTGNLKNKKLSKISKVPSH